jgi:large subunit ribosomal protein L9
MKVILQADIKSLGKKGQVIEVAEGYGRNYLMPRGLAVEASGGNVKILEQKKAADAKKKADELGVAKVLGEKITQAEVIIKTKVGEGGRLFGSVTSKEIAEQLQKSFGISVDKRKIELTDAIKTLGTYTPSIKIHPEVQVTLRVNVIGLD